MDKKDKIDHWDKMYDMPLEQIPWEIQESPKEVVDLIKSGQISGGQALDIACGTGNYSLYLARHGFEVIGVDFSKKAIAIAIKNAEAAKLPVRFVVGDITKIKNLMGSSKFDFILDYSILHHLEPSIIDDYARQCAELLKPEGKLLLVCYSDKDEFADGSNAATGTYGNVMYYRTKSQIRKAYRGLKEIYYRETRLGKRQQHIAHSFLFENPKRKGF